jgi:hypothetical protein
VPRLLNPRASGGRATSFVNDLVKRLSGIVPGKAGKVLTGLPAQGAHKIPVLVSPFEFIDGIIQIRLGPASDRNVVLARDGQALDRFGSGFILDPRMKQRLNMPIQLRGEFLDDIYPMMSHGHGREHIYRDDVQRQNSLKTLA